ncbi:integrin beta-PS [Vanessa tameamea]|uniref:Integrin beta n=1 Tax=Vanessa tameamea TaxID=334116 RepID=A0A8B8IDX7_VANTA|nr:integrin beta-PS [Vanessa tameamea]XP_026495258.1 integrin beta-PS [Vanessa tameamea]XP_026495259.1 integrin beta-PS [Vanessa tameamea]XP_026495260.1 integrin beta-PS [Vanessa tameamea]
MDTQTCLLFCLWASLFVTCLGQRAEQLLAQNPCSSKTTCSDCARTPSCAWCFAPEFNGPRCFNPAMEGGTGGCDEAYIFNPDNQQSIDPIYNRELTRAKGRMGVGMESSYYEESMSSSSSSSSSGGSKGGGYMAAGAGGENLVQIKPQRVKLQLRMNQMQKMTFSYAQAQDYPVDLYYLMDLSRSMKNDKEKLSMLGSLLSSTMRNITSNFRIGFGSFVDKLVMPYVSTVPKNLISPCDGCAAPYGYKNQMSLSNDTDFFDKAVARADVSGNLDAPEGGFDAIMQAVVCKGEIGWREHARKLLVFSTDAGFHYAGDGKLGGIVQPNDGECHMENNSYTHSTTQDYPSISQINLKVKQHAINVIFAVTSEQISVYEQLSKHIEGSSSGILSEDSDNVVDLVREQYNKITSTVEMKDTSSDAVQILYYSSCLGSKDNMVQTSKCDGLKVGDVVEFSAEITLKECPKDPSKWKQSFSIYPVGVSESLNVELEMLCDCPCEHPGHHAYNDSPLVCSGEGTSACGVCVCKAGRFGKSCECSAHGGVSLEQERGCRPTNASSGPLCSNRGTCICGVCECNKMDDPLKVISGPFCECDNFTCDMNKGLLCSGPEHGECVCGKCSCRPEYSGPACQCLKDQTPCISRENGKICSGNGKCVCGQCVCNVDDDRHYSGKYCDKCPTCPGKCEDFKECVLCEVHKRGPAYNPDEPARDCGDCNLFPEVVEGKIEANETLNEHLCSFYDDEDCLYVYVYSYNETQHLHIRAQKEHECPRKVFILGIVLGVIAAIVLVGLALLMLWKMVTTIHDRREFARFEKERMMAKWDTGENPIYKQATSTFKNPTYAGK